MADGAKVELEGFDTLASTLSAAGRDLESMPGANGQAGDIIVRGALSRVPRRTGALASTIQSQPDREGAVVVAGSPPRVRYAAVIEYGSRYVGAQPYLTPGAEATQDQWMRVYQSGVEDALGKVRGA
jgi:hypothetical protein